MICLARGHLPPLLAHRLPSLFPCASSVPCAAASEVLPFSWGVRLRDAMLFGKRGEFGPFGDDSLVR